MFLRSCRHSRFGGRRQKRPAARRPRTRKARFRPHIEPLESRLALAVLFVDHDAPGLDNGTSWLDAFNNLQSALATAQSGDEIWIAEGAYFPTRGTDRSATFQMVDGVDLYGGFAGGETSRDQAEPFTRTTLLNGNIGSSASDEDNSFHVVTVGPGVRSRWDGIRVFGGRANGINLGDQIGAGVLNAGSLLMNRSQFWTNQAQRLGGAIYNSGEMAITRSILSNNRIGSGQGEGGAIYNVGELRISDSSIEYSLARYGGGILQDGSHLSIRNSSLIGNEGGQGGGIYQRSGVVEIAHSTLAYNYTYGAANGAGIFTTTNDVHLTHTLIAGNFQYSYIAPSQLASFPDDVFGPFDAASSFNLVGVGDGSIGLANGVNGNQVGSLLAPIDARLFWAGSWPTVLLAPLLDSPALDAGDPSFDPNLLTPPLTFDQLGKARQFDGNGDSVARIDIGAVETQTLFVTVTTTDDEDDGDYSADDLSLREAISLANASGQPSTIDVPAGHYLLTYGEAPPCDPVGGDGHPGQLIVRGDPITTIRGAGAGQTIIDADGRHRVFLLDGAVTLEDMTIQGGSTERCGGYGAGIFIDEDNGAQTLRRIELAHNVARGNGGGLWADEDNVVRVIDSDIRENRAVEYSEFDSGDGGGIFVDKAAVELIDTRVRDNFAEGDGGGIGGNSNALSVSRSTVESNHALGSGGGVFMYWGTLIVSDSQLRDNSSDQQGGALYANSVLDTISNSVISGNAASSGGGIWTGGEYALTLIDTHVGDNRALNDGGGLFNDGATVSITSGEFLGNQASDDGGGLFTISGDVTVTDTQFIDNGSSDNGGAIRSREGTLTLNGVFVRGNATDDTGGGLYATDGTITIDDSQFIENTTDDRDGGGIAFERGSLTLRNSTIRLNRAGLETDVDGRGGGLWAREADMIQLTDSDVSQNWVAFNGGGIYVETTDQLTIRRSRVADNVSRYSGGGLYTAANVAIESSTIEGNRAQDGGGLYANGGLFLVNIRNSTFSRNQASIEGGGIFLAGAPAEIVQSTISGNSAGEGGGMFVDELPIGRVAAIRHSTITDNVAELGGGLRGYRTSALLSNSILARNRVTNDLWRGTTDLLTPLSPESAYSLVGIGSAETIGVGPGLQFGTAAQPLDPRLGPLEYNGGPTRTHLPLPGSPVIEAGDPAFNPASYMPPLVTDQRGQWRVVDGDGDLMARIDIGAVEFSPIFLFADVTQDGRVDLLDLVLLQSNIGDATAEYSQGDLNADGRIDQTDAAILLENFGRVQPLPPPPAPAAATAAKRVAASRSAAPARKTRLSATAIRRAPIAAAIDRALTTEL